MLFFLQKSYGQILSNTSGEVLWIGQGTQVTIHGGVLNRGTINHNGTLSLTGDWINEGNYVANEGKVILEGEEQQINHNNQQIARLQVSGGGVKNLVSNLNITDSLMLSMGKMVTNNLADNAVVLENETVLIGGSDSSYIQGALVQKGTGYKYFPVGSESQFSPLELIDVLGVNPTLMVTVKQPNSDSLNGANLEQVSAVRYWRIRTLDGSFEGSQVSLAISEDEGLPDLVGVVVAEAEEPSGKYNSLGKESVSGTRTSGVVTSADPVRLPYVAIGITNEFSLDNEVVIANAFDPNAADAENRTIKVYATNIAQDNFVFKIFNRWGNMVYQTTSVEEALQQGWDGVDQQTGKPAPFGVYSYFLRGRFDNGNPVEKTGTITLFR